MKHIGKILVIASFLLVNSLVASGAKLVKVKLTGTFKEDMEMKVGNSGRTEVISSLPYVFQISKEELPVRLQFYSPNYQYLDITIPVEPVDEIGHIYLVKYVEGQPAPVYYANAQPQAPAASTPKKKVVKGIDFNHGVNKAPYTGKKSEKTFALIIANENYEMAGNVDMATNDGLAVKEYLTKTYGLSENQIFYYPDATYGKIAKALRDIKAVADAYHGDINLIFYYAGHGIPDNATKDAFIMPVDADGTDTNVCYSLTRIYDQLEAMKLKQCVVLLDACFSGAQRNGAMIVEARGVAIKPKPAEPNGATVVISATSGEETAFSYKEKKHGLFTYFLLKYLQENKNKVTLGGLADYISTQVSQQSVLVNGKKQTPSVFIADDIADDWRERKFTDSK